MPVGNNSIFGAFSLSELRSGRLTGEWLNKETVANYGWFGGGTTAAASISTADRIDFSNDTATALSRGSISLERQRLAATGNSNYGWFGGGSNPGTGNPQFSTVDRIDFSNDSSIASVRGSLSSSRYNIAATGNSNYGWFGGGAIPAVPVTSFSTVDRIDFSNDSSTASPRGTLSLARGQLAAAGNSNYGWFGGGLTPTPASVSTVDRIDFSNDSFISSPRGPLSIARFTLSATGNSNYGWFGATSAVGTTNIDRINFANDSATALIRGVLSSTRYSGAATGNSNYGWFGGGLTPTPASVSTVDRIDFSNDSAIASVRGSLSLARNRVAATSGVLNIRRQKAGNFGWFGGGAVPALPAPLVRSTVDRIDFSNDTATASVRGSLSLSRQQLSAAGNSNYGWFGGGFTPTPARFTTVDRINFSNDTATASSRGPLSLARNALASTGNSDYGWYCGGNMPAFISATERINFSNDSATASPRGPLSQARSQLAATGNSNYGWFGGGYNPALGAYPNNMISAVDRIDFSNDSATASVRGPLSSARYWMGATGNSNFGWFGGGFSVFTTNITSATERIDFSNDSATASPRGNLISARRNVHATGNSNYGWFSGDFSGTILSVVDRINFSNDTATASPRGPLSVARFSFTSTSNTLVG